MPICITCSTPVRNLYTTYSKADDRSLGKGVRLTQCPNCKRFADKYVEHDYVVLFIDLVLIKPQVYRHLLFNRLGRTDDKLDPSILRLGILLILFDVYITWARIEKSNSSNTSGGLDVAGSNFSTAPIITQYLFFLTLNTFATLAQHITIRLLVRLLYTRQAAAAASGSPNPSSLRNSPSKSQLRNSPNPAQPEEHHNFQSKSHFQDESQQRMIGPGRALPSAISTALLVSSCTKLFPILLVIWPTTPSSSSSSPTSSETPTAASSTSTSSLASFAHRATSYIGWIVLLNNVEALLILLNCGYAVATGLAVAGMVARWCVEGWLLGLVGLVRDGGGNGDGPVGDLIGLVWWSRG